MTIDLSVIEHVPREAIPHALGELEKVRAILWARLAAPEAGQTHPGSDSGGAERLLTVQEVAARLQTSRNWVYRHAAKLGGVKAGGKMRFTREGLVRYLARNRKRS